ncbi:uncharacterized protein LOC121395741 [Xenopus laevis]|uniref:Uncharacterized protein LOC121395741 n=1 Tax=Xenopus laevis TaxID=8355 RepID=A0A8J1L8T8_XENLA|nr:uncharacterized protein LOC121395741 [Xenopus laevis]
MSRSLAVPTGLSFLLCVCQGLVVTQEKRLLLVLVGGSVEIPCRQDGDNLYMYWYQQKAGEGLELMVVSAGADAKQTVEGKYAGRWSLNRTVIGNMSLKVTGAEAGDSATYLCSASLTDTEATDQPATKLSPMQFPSVTCRGRHFFCLAAPVLQYPTVQLSHPGDNVTVQCEHNDGSYIRKYWYRQENNGPLTLLGSTYTTQETVPCIIVPAASTATQTGGDSVQN